MKSFSVKFNAGSLELAAIVTASERLQRFKVELVTGETDPIILKRDISGNWSVENTGTRTLNDEQFITLQQAIETELTQQYNGNTILVLTDFSSAADNAAIYAAGLSRQLQSTKIIVYHSSNHLSLLSGTFAPIPSNRIQSGTETTAKLTALHERMLDLVDDTTAIEVLHDSKALVPAVNLMTEQHHVGLIVMGMAEKNTMQQVLIGSNAINVTRGATTSVLIVPEHASFRLIKNVAFACDLKDVSRTVPVFPIKFFINKTKAKLSILYVNKVDGETDPEAKTELRKLQKIWNEQSTHYYYGCHENIEDGILDFADENTMELLLTVPKEYSFFEQLFHRSLTQNLAYKTHIPLLVLKEDH